MELINDKRIEAYSSSRNEPDWFREQRLAAYREMADLAFPKIERSRYDENYDLSGQNFDMDSDVVRNIYPDKMEHCFYIKCFHNQLIDMNIPRQYSQQGVIVETIQQAMKDHPDLLRKYYLSKIKETHSDKITAHHQAFMNMGLLIYIPKNMCIEETLQVILVQDGQEAKAYHPHVLIIIDEGSELSYLEKVYTIGGESATVNLLTEAYLAPRSNLKFAVIDDLGTHTSAYMRRYAYLTSDATITWSIGAMNKGDTVSDYYAHLVGQGSQAYLNVISLTQDDQEHVINSKIVNQGQHSIGHILQHGVIMGQSTLTMNGIGHILANAKNADAQQASRILMLSEHARGDANPILLIDEFEVQAGHAASVGQLDSEELYYLMSRGIEKKEAERLVIRGFLGAVINQIPTKEDRLALIESIEGKLMTV